MSVPPPHVVLLSLGVVQRSAVNLEKQYRVDVLLLFGGLGALSLFVLMEVLRFYSGLRGLLVGFLLYDGIILPGGLLYIAVVLRRIALAIRGPRTFLRAILKQGHSDVLRARPRSVFTLKNAESARTRLLCVERD